MGRSSGHDLSLINLTFEAIVNPNSKNKGIIVRCFILNFNIECVLFKKLNKKLTKVLHVSLTYIVLNQDIIHT